MQAVDLVIEAPRVDSLRARQCASIFDVSVEEKLKVEWHGEIDLGWDWQVGLIVGPSGCGKSTLARHILGTEAMQEPVWSSECMLDDFPPDMDLQQITHALSSVGFNTIPAWMRPYSVLSNGEKFRADIARHMVEDSELTVIDEFTSVVDRQVAKCASHSVQKFVRKGTKKLVAVTCHYDVEDWLQPDWVLEPADMTFRRRSVQPRPRIDVVIRKVPKATWALFAPYHYLTHSMPSSAHCFAAFIEGQPVAFTAACKLVHPLARNIYRIARTVVLPDWQGLRLSFALNNALGDAFTRLGYRFRNYPASPGYVRAHAAQPNWACTQLPGAIAHVSTSKSKAGLCSGSSCAVFEYRGPSAKSTFQARMLLGIPPYAE